jgi:hypothetical protein
MNIYGFASGFAFGYDPTGRSVFYKIDRSTQKLTTGGIHYSTFDVGRSMFDVHQFLSRIDWTLAASGDAEH